MDPIENERATIRELISFAQQQGLDMESLRNDSVLETDQRWIFLWKKDGLLHYNMQGSIDVLPRKLKGSAGAFQGAWTEAGTFENIEQAFHFVKAWLLDQSEVDELPGRHVRRYGI